MPKLEVSFNKAGQIVAAYARVVEGVIVKTIIGDGGDVIVDYGEDGTLLGIEFLGKSITQCRAVSEDTGSGT